MANTRSSEKRNRQSQKRRARNLSIRNNVKSVIRKAREAIAAGDSGKAKEAVSVATRIIDRASSKGVLAAGNAARRISRLAHALAHPESLKQAHIHAHQGATAGASAAAAPAKK